MNKTWEARFLGKDNMVLDVWYYYCAYTVYVVHVSYMMCAHAVLCIYNMCTCCLCSVMYKMVQIVLYECYIFNTEYRWCCVHVGYVVFCTYCNVYMMDMRCCVHMVLCAC